MLVISNRINLYGRKVITDLAMRHGSHTMDSFSYGQGLHDVVMTFWKDDEDTPSIMESLFETQADYDCDRKKISLDEEQIAAGEYEEDTFAAYDPAKDPIDFKEYNRRLEDIPTDCIKEYIGNVVFNICRHDSALRKFQQRHRVQPCFIGSKDDDDDFTELADLQVEDREEWSLGQKQVAQRNLSYVIRRLHNMSRYSKVHMLSYIAAYERAKVHLSEAHSNGSSSRSLSDNLVIAEGVYLCDEDGNITKRVAVENKNKRAKGMFNWIVGRECEYSAYYIDYINFIHYCNVLDINIIDDDMTKYQASFVNKLVVTTVTPNKQYVPAVYNALKNNSDNIVETHKPTVDTLRNTVESFEQLCQVNAKMRLYISRFSESDRKRNFDYAYYIANYYSFTVNNQALVPDKFTWQDGFLHYDDKVFIMPANWLGNSNRLTLSDNRCIISELGYIVALTDTADVYIITVNNAYDNVKSVSSGFDPDYKRVNWERLLS